MGTTKQFCTFHLGELFLGVEVQQVQEVIRWQDLTRVPLAPSMLRGLINLRGQIVTALDLRERFGMPPLQGEEQPTNIVVRTEDGPMSLLVDSIGDVLEVDDECADRAPENLPAIIRKATRGVYKLEGHLLLTLDIEKTIQFPAASARQTSIHDVASHAAA